MLKFWLPVIIWAGLIFYFSSHPRIDSGVEKVQAGVLDLILRKCVHIFEYFMLNVLFYRAIKGSFNLDGKRLFFYSVLFCVLYALMDEYHQTFVPTRTGSIYDVMVDSIGIAIAYVILRWKSGLSKG